MEDVAFKKNYLFMAGECCPLKKIKKKKNLSVARECCHSPQTPEATFYTKVCK